MEAAFAEGFTLVLVFRAELFYGYDITHDYLPFRSWALLFHIYSNLRQVNLHYGT